MLAAGEPELPDCDRLFGKEALAVRVERGCAGFWKSGSGYRPQLPAQCVYKRARLVRAAPFEQPPPMVVSDRVRGLESITRGGGGGGSASGSSDSMGVSGAYLAPLRHSEAQYGGSARERGMGLVMSTDAE